MTGTRGSRRGSTTARSWLFPGWLAPALALALGGAGAAACSDDDALPETPALDAAVPEGGDAARQSEPDAAAPDARVAAFSCATIDASAVVFCNDFEAQDGGAGAPFGFDDGFVGPDASAGSLTLSNEGGLAHPSLVLDVALAQLPDSGLDTGQSVFLTKSLPAGNAPSSYARYDVDFDVRVVGTASLAYVALGVLAFPEGAIKEHGLAVYDGNVFGRLVPKDFAVKDDKSLWHHARISLERGSGPTSFATTVDVDGTLVDNVGGVGVGETGTPSIRIGAFATSANVGGAIRVQFDNVVVRRR